MPLYETGGARQLQACCAAAESAAMKLGVHDRIKLGVHNRIHLGFLSGSARHRGVWAGVKASVCFLILLL